MFINVFENLILLTCLLSHYINVTFSQHLEVSVIPSMISHLTPNI